MWEIYLNTDLKEGRKLAKRRVRNLRLRQNRLFKKKAKPTSKSKKKEVKKEKEKPKTKAENTTLNIPFHTGFFAYIFTNSFSSKGPPPHRKLVPSNTYQNG